MATTAKATENGRDLRCRDRDTCEGFKMRMCEECGVDARYSVPSHSNTEPSVTCPDIDCGCKYNGGCEKCNCSCK